MRSTHPDHWFQPLISSALLQSDWPALCRRLAYLRALGPLTIAVLGIAIVNIFKLQCPSSDKNKVCAKSIRVVGNIPKGLPGCTIGWWSPIPQVGKKFGYAVIICLIDLLESISIAKALALKNRYEIM